MSDVLTLPILSLPDVVVLPGMVVPIELDGDARAVIDAARAGSSGQLLLAPRLADRYPVYGVIAEIEQVGRLPGGAPAAVLRAGRRARIGSGVPGPGAALWVEAEPVEDAPVTDARARARRRVQAGRRRHPAAPQRLAGDRLRPADHRPVRARRHGRLRAVPVRRAEARAARDARRRGPAYARPRLGARAPRRARGHREDPRRRPRGHGQAAARVPAARAARRDPQGTGRGRAGRRRRLPHPRRGGRPARQGPRGGAARGRQAGALE